MRWINLCLLDSMLAPRAIAQFPSLNAVSADSIIAPASHERAACPQCHSQACCCSREVCVPTIEKVTEERSCWNVTCEKVCIPAVRMPWEAGGSRLTLFSWLRSPCCGTACLTCGCANGGCTCCLPACGQVRCVNVLGSEDYEVTKCQCKWEIRRLPPCNCVETR
jgi:hypothetical protein